MEWTKGAALRFKNARWETALYGALVRRGSGRLELAVPYSPQRPFPLPELMCFAKLSVIDGENRIIYAFNEQSAPIF